MKIKDIFQYCFAALIVIGFFVLVYAVFIKGLPPENKDVAYLLVGALVAVFTSVVNYFFASTKGSAEKTDIIAKSPPIIEAEKK
jgi:drug/metabolite transporter (DMT)-like permease